MRKFLLLFSFTSFFLYSYTFEKIISRENPLFELNSASFTIGKDGNVYFFNPIKNRWDGFIYRVSLDGKLKKGINVGYGGSVNVTANSDGIIAEASAHFRHTVTLYNKSFEKIYEIPDFLVNDTVGWDSPGHIEAGDSGDFYALDQNRNRILRITANGKIKKIYEIPKIENTKCYDFRVCENKNLFYLLYWGKPLICIDFDGNKKWEYFINNNFDVDINGNLYHISPFNDTLEIISSEGKPYKKVKLEIDKTNKPLAKFYIKGMRIYKEEIFLRRFSETDFFEIYNLKTGEFIRKIECSYEKIKIELPSPILTLEQKLPFKVEFLSNSENKIILPQFRIFVKPIEYFDFIELKIEKGEIYIPQVNPGIYFLVITPDLNPRFQNNFEYTLIVPVILKEKNTDGIILIYTPSNRIFYAKGEPINFYIKIKGKEEITDLKIKLYRLENLVTKDLIFEEEINLKITNTFQIPPSITEILNPGSYILTTDYLNYMNIGQIFIIGNKNLKEEDEFKIINYGDYGLTFPREKENFVFLSPQSIFNHTEKSKKLGINLFVDRVGYPASFYALKWEPGWGELKTFEDIKTLAKENDLNIEEKIEILSPFLQVLSNYTAYGIKQMGILLGNDAGLPLGTGFDHRKPEELLKTIESLTKQFVYFPSFRGWIWASNWWIFHERGGEVLKTTQEKEKYQQSIKEANEKGKWDSILDKAAEIRLGYAVEAIKMFNKKLKEISDKLKTSVACPYRNVESYPPVTMKDVDECDLQAQWEQIPPPYYAPFNVDFYKRPGKKDLSHPEIWNDSGTGEQILTTLFLMIMRGSESVGNSGSILPWGNLKRDKRSAYYGTISIYRNFYNWVKEYGPWLTKLKNDDKIAIIADGRMYKIDTWGNIMGVHFARVFEAYLTCLFAHKPSSIIFSEDIKKDTFKDYKLVLVIDQRVEFEKNVLEALKEAQKSGTKIYYDETCNKEIVKDFLPLGIAFNKIEKDHSLHSDDHAYWRVKNYIFSNLSSLKKIFDDIDEEVEIEEPEVFITQKKGENEKYIFIVNTKNADIGPEFLWRITINVATTLPMKIPLKFKNYEKKYIYDITQLKEIKPDKDGKIECNLNEVPFRIYAIFPQKIENVEVYYPTSITKGSKFFIRVRILDNNNNIIKSIIPIKIRIVDEYGNVVYEENSYTDSKGKNFEITIPLNLSTSKLKFDVLELISRKKCSGIVNILPSSEKVINFKSVKIKEKKPEKLIKSNIIEENYLSCDERFGPRVKDFTFNSDKTKILINTMNWDTNLYCFDLKNNKTLWNKKIGHYYAFAPKNFGNNFIVEGYDIYSTEGYALYLLDRDNGHIRKKFAFFGIPQRMCHRFVPGILNDNFDEWCIDEKNLYIAIAGNFGIVVWDKEGNLLWRKDWWSEKRDIPLLSFSEKFLIVGEKNKIYAVNIQKKEIVWEIDLIPQGNIKHIKTYKNIIAVYSETDEGNIIFVFKDNGNLLVKFYTSSEEMEISPDGLWIGSIKDNQLKLFNIQEGFKWSFSGDEILEGLSFSPDSQRLIVSSILGTFYVLDINGRKILEKDIGEKNIGKWINEKECVIVTWMGKIYKLSEDDLFFLAKISNNTKEVKFEKEKIETLKVENWGNSVKIDFSPKENIFNKQNVIIQFVGKKSYTATNENYADLINKEIMVDGDIKSPESPYIPWTFINWMAETMPFGYLLFDGFNTIYKVESLTIFEDPEHPEFWLKDASFEYWDEENNKWIFVDYLVSNSAIHTHLFNHPVISSKFRIVMPSNFYSNLKFGEICFHGEKIICSHPDIIKKKNFVTLFDEDDLNYWKEHFYPQNLIEFGYKEPASGEKYLIIKSGLQGPIWRPPFGHAMRNWNFEIVENPEKPEEFRYLQFYWKKINPNTKNFSLIFNNFAFYAGEYKGPSWYKTMKISDEIPSEWKLERIDLWKFLRGKTKITSISFITDGEIAIDQIVLSKTEKDLEELKFEKFDKLK